MNFGAQTVTFVTITDGPPDRNGIPAEVRTDVAVPGCRFRPLRTDEKIGLTDIANEVWKCTAPPVTAVLEATTVSELKYLNETYQLLGEVQPFNDMGSTVHKVTVLAKKQTS